MFDGAALMASVSASVSRYVGVSLAVPLDVYLAILMRILAYSDKVVLALLRVVPEFQSMLC